MITTIDDFLPDFELVKKFISGVEYKDFEFMGKNYTGFGAVTLPVKALIEEVCGPIKIKMNHLRLGRRDTPLTHYIHADRYGTALAFVLCLSAPECETGTAFWKHKQTGLEFMDANADDLTFDYFDKEIKDESAWEMTAMVKSVENRAIIFDANQFHSRWPKELPINKEEKPRIVCTTFFDVL